MLAALAYLPGLPGEFVYDDHRLIVQNDGLRRPFDPARGCLVTNLSKMPAERLDFGTGGPAAIVPLTIEKNSAAILARGENFVLRYAY